MMVIDDVLGREIVLSCSGGKDSAAAGLFLMEKGLPFHAMFCDTGWEHPETYAYLRGPLTQKLGRIVELEAHVAWPEVVKLPLLRAKGADAETVRAEERAAGAALAQECESRAQEIEALLENGGRRSAFVRIALKKAVFPARTLRWCTQELKTKVARAYFDTLDDPVNVVGIRGEESSLRAAMPEYEYEKDMDVDVWRPLLMWTLDDVIAIHHRHGLTPNPLYLRTATRVGCYPCIFAKKKELSTLDDKRVAALRLLEKHVSELALARIARAGKDVYMAMPTFFQAENKNSDGGYAYPIDKVMEWAKTAHGGKQVEMFAAAPRDAGCMRWGLCDTGAGGEE